MYCFFPLPPPTECLMRRIRLRSGGVLRVVQQKNNGVELLPGPIVRSQRDDEVVQTVPRRLCRHYDQLVLEAVRFSVLKAVVCAALCGDRRLKRTSVR